MTADERAPDDPWDPLHEPGPPGSHWSTVNVGEALPGVASPLGFSIWADIGDRMCRDLSYRLGVFGAAERVVPADPRDRIIRPFHGRIAMRMEWLASVGDRMPGTTGEQAIAGMLGQAPDTMAFAPTRRRYPVIAYRLPVAGVVAPRRVRALAPVIDSWWRSRIPVLAAADHALAVEIFTAALGRFSQTMTLHGIALFSAVTPLWNAVNALVEKTGVGDAGTLSGTGGAEMTIVEDIWKASRGQLTVDEVAANHGFHGPLEGEISSRVWREDPKPLVAMIERYATRDESDNPLARDREAKARLLRMQREVAAALPAVQRPAVLALLRHAARTIPLRGVGKASFLQALDVARASARRIGEHLASAGALADPDDVFYLTVAELTGPVRADARELVARRRRRRAEYQQLELPSYWRDLPVPERIEAAGERENDDDVALTGIGASAGTVEGIVRVVTDPGFADVEPGEILVAPSTDPSWASIMFIAGALVVDIGGMISHAAVVARELELPCVVNTRTGTRVLRDGDRVRVDGTAGTVEVLQRAVPVDRGRPGLLSEVEQR
jgi:phosphohistidine swiveling domain-containing protein